MVYQFKLTDRSTAFVNVKADSIEQASEAIDIWLRKPETEYVLEDMLDKGYMGLSTEVVNVKEDSFWLDCDIDAEEVLE